MSLQVAWQLQLVEEFCSQGNWEGALSLADDLAEPSIQISSFSALPEHWLGVSVQAFFSSNNWSGNSYDPWHSDSARKPLSLIMEVKEFFAGFAWEGNLRIAVVPEEPYRLSVDSANPEEFTLTNLIDLF